jgi:hypothetical protein
MRFNSKMFTSSGAGAALWVARGKGFEIVADSLFVRVRNRQRCHTSVAHSEHHTPADKFGTVE